MSETPAETSEKRGFFGTIIRFFREVIGELKKVVTPTRKELINYTMVVLGFVIFMMLLVTVLDLLFGKLSGFIFGGSPIWPLWG